jgi:hypothetical protein
MPRSSASCPCRPLFSSSRSISAARSPEPADYAEVEHLNRTGIQWGPLLQEMQEMRGRLRMEQALTEGLEEPTSSRPFVNHVDDRACGMPNRRMNRPAQLLALSLIALGASTLHGIRSPGASVPTALRPATSASAAVGGAGTSARNRTMRACAASRERGRSTPDCVDQR